jgi:CheY-specific phosphatase CheX
MMDSASWKVANEMLTACGTSLFASMGVEIVAIADAEPNPPRAGERVMAFVGFGGSELRGALSLDMPTAFVAQLHPALSEDPAMEKEDLCDWAGELANQLLGKLKSRVAAYGVTLQMSTPSTVWGQMTHARRDRSERFAERHFSASEHRIVLYLDGIALVPVDLTKASAAVDEELPAGVDTTMYL